MILHKLMVDINCDMCLSFSLYFRWHVAWTVTQMYLGILRKMFRKHIILKVHRFSWCLKLSVSKLDSIPGSPKRRKIFILSNNIVKFSFTHCELLCFFGANTRSLFILGKISDFILSHALLDFLNSLAKITVLFF